MFRRFASASPDHSRVGARSEKGRSLRVGTLTLVGLMAAGLVVARADDASDTPPQICADCHDEIAATFVANPHSALDTRGLADLVSAPDSCASCHGDPQNHLLEGGGPATILGFGDGDSAIAGTARCQSCHQAEHPGFEASSHGRLGLGCISCHTIHGAAQFAELVPAQTFTSALESDRVSESCRSCHSPVFARFELNERHRLQEGILECTSCHDPHEPTSRPLLGGFKQSLCADCHADKDGPFVFEHGSSRVEGCVSCHAVHGSPNRHLLTFQNVADLCYSCHGVVSAFHASLGPDNQCTNCHSTIHGSNINAFFLR